ncbi:hypothetical protein EJB05_01028, partial [Eragrostis curvula]
MKVPMLLPLIVIVALVCAPAAEATCQRWCGGVEIPYPFGIGRGCYRRSPGFGDDQQDFEVKCSNRTGKSPIPMVYDFEVIRIDVRRGQLRVRSPVSSWCYDFASRTMGEAVPVSYESTAFRVSDADNVLAVVGCNALAFIGSQEGDVDNRHVVGCHAACPGGRRFIAGDGSPCNGTGGCCQMAIPPGIRSFDLSFVDSYNISGDVAEFNPCSYAMVVDREAFKFRTSYVTTRELLHVAGGQVPAVLDWAVGNETCEVATWNRTTYACVSDHSKCVNSVNGPGYLCNCSQGYQGNPYVPGGCKGQCYFLPPLLVLEIITFVRL